MLWTIFLESSKLYNTKSSSFFSTKKYYHHSHPFGYSLWSWCCITLNYSSRSKLIYSPSIRKFYNRWIMLKTFRWFLIPTFSIIIRFVLINSIRTVISTIGPIIFIVIIIVTVVGLLHTRMSPWSLKKFFSTSTESWMCMLLYDLTIFPMFVWICWF